MAKRSAGLLPYRVRGGTEVLIGHMGGPYWARRDRGAWSIPKGEHGSDEEPLAAARREFVEELGIAVPDGEPIPLGEVRQAGGKIVAAWAIAADVDPDDVRPGTFTMEWPPRSGVSREYPELDRVGWFTLEDAAERIVSAQVAFLDRLRERLDDPT